MIEFFNNSYESWQQEVLSMLEVCRSDTDGGNLKSQWKKKDWGLDMYIRE